MQLIQCNIDQNGQDILEIFNHAIAHTTALYEYQPRTMEDIQHWFNIKERANVPVLGIINQQQLLGFASYGQFRPYPANQFTAELAIYVDEKAQGQGIASQLLTALIDHAKQQKIHTLIAAIDEENLPSIALHQKFHFNHCGTLKEVGYKFDKWLNLCLYQLMLG